MYRIIEWITTLAMAVLIDKVCDFVKIVSSKKVFAYFPYIILISPFSYTICSYLGVKYSNLYDILDLTNATLYGLMLVIIIYVLLREIIQKQIYSIVATSTGKDENQKNKKKESNEQLGLGEAIIDRVIRSTLFRAQTSGRSVFFSLIIMVVIVIIGGSASFGTLALNEANEVHQLEGQRKKMLEIVRHVQNTSDAKVLEQK